MTNCPRCEKPCNEDIDWVHTCSPRGAWRKGMDEATHDIINHLRFRLKQAAIENDDKIHIDLMYKWLADLEQGKSDE